MSREYRYLEAMEEIIRSNDKEFEHNFIGEVSNKPIGLVMFFNKNSKSISIRCKTHRIGIKNSEGKIEYKKEINELFINDSWVNSKWTLVEEKKNYNVRTYNVNSGKLISSENVTMTKEEIENYRGELFNKGKVEEDIKSGIGEGIVLFKNTHYEYKIVCEIITT